jgi:hypothetical protein
MSPVHVVSASENQRGRSASTRHTYVCPHCGLAVDSTIGRLMQTRLAEDVIAWWHAGCRNAMLELRDPHNTEYHGTLETMIEQPHEPDQRGRTEEGLKHEMMMRLSLLAQHGADTACGALQAMLWIHPGDDDLQGLYDAASRLTDGIDRFRDARRLTHDS